MATYNVLKLRIKDVLKPILFSENSSFNKHGRLKLDNKAAKQEEACNKAKVTL